jgi:hypothetical protein
LTLDFLAIQLPDSSNSAHHILVSEKSSDSMSSR